MTVENEVIRERRADSHQKIQSLVTARTKTLSLYSRFASLQPFNERKDMAGKLQRFCQALIDYTASAHFTLYKYIDENKERRKNVIDVAHEVYPCIVESTQVILDFNDKYDSETHCEDLSGLAADLSGLGEALADRIEMEDRLIDALTRRR